LKRERDEGRHLLSGNGEATIPFGVHISLNGKRIGPLPSLWLGARDYESPLPSIENQSCGNALLCLRRKIFSTREEGGAPGPLFSLGKMKIP